MNVDLLRGWVRDELDPATRREVGRWMLRAQDPELPGILQGFVREHEEELADAAFAARWPDRGFLVELWRRMLDAGRAGVEALGSPALAGGAVLGAGVTETGLCFRAVDDEVVVDITLAGEQRLVAVLATTDRGDEHVLFGPRELSSGTYMTVARWAPEAEDGRVTVWLATVPVGGDVGALRTVQAAATSARTGTAELVAARWSETD